MSERQIALSVCLTAFLGDARADEPPLAEVAAELERRYALDQQIRGVPIDHAWHANAYRLAVTQSLAAAMAAVDRDNTAWMKGVVDRHGWPGQSLVGERGAHCAWLLVQHADLDRPFQKRCLALLRDASAGEVKPQELAYLEDRVLVGEGEPQRFGTQLRIADGRLVPQPIEHPAGVDACRAEVGLPPLAEYVETAERYYLSPE